ncbi:MAG TPA: DUF2231 domain-containing protein [Bryobacteraceae bacterium]|jgi:uncharacterized membrane protein|nr:DUF2231 domain-containing protein [Bryobacteraceae bacterium]
MIVNPFDVKTLLFAKHAQHVVLIHFPIALFVIGVAFDFLAQRTGPPALAAAAYYNLAGAAIMTIPTLITGVVAWQWALEGQRLKGILLMHMVMGCVSSLLIWVAWLIHMRTQRSPARLLPGYRLPIEAGAVAIVAFTGYLGGFLSGVNVPS